MPMRQISKINILVYICAIIFSLIGTFIVTINTTYAQSITREYTLIEPLPCIDGVSDVACSNGYVRKINLYSILGYLYRLLLAIAAILAVARIMYGGVLYMTTEAFTGKSEAKTIIRDAVLGLFMTLGSFVFLRTIDPEIVNLAKDPLPPVSSNKTFNIRTLGQLIDAEQKALNSISQSIQKNSVDSKTLIDANKKVSEALGSGISQKETLLANLNAKPNKTDQEIAQIASLEKEILNSRTQKLLVDTQEQALDKINDALEDFEDVLIPQSAISTADSWARSDSIFSTKNPYFRVVAIQNPESVNNRIVNIYTEAFSKMAELSNVGGGKILVNQRNTFTDFINFATTVIDLEKRHAAFATKVTDVQKPASQFKKDYEDRVQDTLDGMKVRLSENNLKDVFGSYWKTSPAAQYYTNNMNLYIQRLEAVKMMYK